ncbi:hypothetical protein L1049_011898 [Liquidambar formosana]|uniref:Uncharacterized protein n=1 Tax=Liquidambar formosana TaxID=63359 RepID=A0AAP0RSR5_LIQFO
MAETQAKSENTVIVSTNEPKQPNPIFQHFQNIWLGFQQQLKPKPKADDVVVAVAAEEPAIRTALEEKESSEQKPDLVKFGDPRPIVPPPLKLEAEELEQSSSPTVRWQFAEEMKFEGRVWSVLKK